jgi:hypothetical protein
MIIKRVEFFEREEFVTYLQDNGAWGKKETARVFDTKEDAEDMIELEKEDPVYDKGFTGECSFWIEEEDK